MAYSLFIAKAAEKDIREGFLWYESKKAGLGTSFEEHILSAVAHLRQHPHASQIRYGSTRIFFLKKFPFGIHFRVEESNIIIVAVFHTSRSSGRWEAR